MKKFLFALIAVLSFSGLSAQIVKPVKWTQRLEKVSPTEFKLVMEATIDESWHIYSQFTPDGGPLPLTLDFKNQKGNYQLIGKAAESATKRQFNDVFEVDEVFWEKKATLTQRIKVINPNLTSIDVKVDYQVCKEVCINDNAKFTFKLPKIPVEEAAAITTPIVKDTASSIQSKDTVGKNSTSQEEVEQTKTVATVPNPQKTENIGLWTIFFLAFGAGFTALLTPCVFPMIPMTVSIFTKQSKNKSAGIRNAILYGISIIIIYVVLGLVITAIFGAGALNAIATNVWFNLIFFVLLVIFAISFLGAFEIVLPNSWANKVDRQADRGGFIGILFMALALAIVSFSCTGIFIGNLLVVAAQEGGIAPIIGMFGFSLALALPFMLFAMFPGWLNSLPKSGGWLNTVKVFLGFLELALAFKFLSNADLVLQMHLLEREVFLAIWIAIFGALALYLFGKITTPHDSPLPFISVGRLLLGLLVLTFTVYLIPGLWGAPLKLISAFPPPLEYSESPHGVGNSSAIGTNEDLPKDAVMAHGFVTFNDYDKALAYAKEVNKPMLLDFTGFACVNCRKMENNVWTDAEVAKILKNDVILVSLYVDDKRELPKEQQFISPSTGEEIETTGDKWTDFMITRYKTNTQPMYVLVGTDGKDISNTISYVGKDEYLGWLRKGLEAF
ncbi:thioredoxin family protein [Flavobacterium sp. MAH-1]|uniref:Thioredoxin family protein n=1 Tax=Flavobacterium agri TaxID=2743471 RepID=A0A7Y8XZ49_9FLAO|nr:cytochrome c biogenesis protein CcdA [Flavobacterium agri]NUY79574.1 thioredoxin family protein [Flavobacterium agri]NYA69599.1 thioredoxin family protein [Flavobacterium agri]